MKYVLAFSLVILFSCNSGTNDNTQRNMEDPLIENPEKDAIPEDMHIKNDSVVVPVDSGRDTSRLNMDTMRHQ